MALTTNLVAYWKLDANSQDATGNGHTGTDTAITYNPGNGKIIQGAGFDGSSSKITYGPFTFGITMSISFWLLGLPSNGVFFMDSTGSRMYMWFPGAAINTAWGGADSGNITHSLSGGTWAHIVFTTDGVNGQFYKNGITLGASMAFAPTSITSTVSRFGANFSDTAGTFLNTPLDEIGIWNRALSSAEITQLYNGGSGLTYPFTAGANTGFFAFL